VRINFLCVEHAKNGFCGFSSILLVCSFLQVYSLLVFLVF